MTKRMICFGTHILDTVALPVEHIPEGQSSTRVDRILHAPAGTAAGVAVDVAQLGFPITSIGVIGADSTGQFLASMMADMGVDTRGIATLDGPQTSSSVLLVDAEGNRPALHVRGVNAIATWEDVDASFFDEADIVHFGGMDAMTGLDTNETMRRIRELREQGVVITMDFQSASQHLRADLLDLVAEVDAFLPNDEQACGLMRTESVEEAASQILSLGTQRVIITCGADGLYYADRDGLTFREPAVPTQVLDTTGCGDSVSAVYLIGLSTGLEVEESLRIAAEAGAAVAAGIGSLGALPNWDELVLRVERQHMEASQ